MKYNVSQILKAVAPKAPKDNLNSIVKSLEKFGEEYKLLKPHRLAQFLAQILHESGDLKYDRELWGPTEAQKRYDTRTDLGNTPAKDGDGKLYMGRTAMQLTGKSNYTLFRDWCRKEGYDCPDFVKEPDKVNTDPWEGLVPIWYWEARNLSKYADQGDIETITKKVNGGMNGFDDRVDKYVRVALAMLDYGQGELRKFQADRRLNPDNDPGPKTRAALHGELVALTPGEMKKATVQVAPVTEQIKEVIPVTPPALEAPWYSTKEFWTTALTGGGFTVAAGFIKDLATFPTTNLVILVAAGFIGLGGFLLYRRSLDKQRVKSEVENLEKGK